MGFMKNVNKNNIVEFSSTPLKSNIGNKNSNTIPKRISKADINTLLISIPFLCINVITDISLGIYYAHIGATYFSFATFAFLLFSQIIIQLFSIIWYFNDGCRFHLRKIIVHICLLQPVERYMVLFKKARIALHQKSYGINPSREESVTRFYELHNDVNILRLFSVYIGTVPQFCLQVFIILSTDHQCVFTYISCVFAMLTLGWVQINYTHAIRHVYSKPDHIDNQLVPHLPQYVLLSLAHISFVISRSLSLALFASVYNNYVWLILLFHGIVMLIWVVIQKPDFASNFYEHGLYIFVVSIIYMFTFFNVKEGNTRYRAISFYGLSALENITLLSAWKYYVQSEPFMSAIHSNAIPITVFVLYFFGIICIFIYYTFFHPNGFGMLSTSESTEYSETESSISCANSNVKDWNYNKPNQNYNKQNQNYNKQNHNYNKQNEMPINDNFNNRKSSRKFRSSGIHADPIRFTKVDNESISPIGFRSCVTDVSHSVYHDAVDGSYDVEGFQHYSIDASKADTPLNNRIPSARHDLNDLFADAANSNGISSDTNNSQLNRNIRDSSIDSADIEVFNTMVVLKPLNKPSPHKRRSRIAGPFRKARTYNYDISHHPQVKFQPQVFKMSKPKTKFVDAITQYTPKSSHTRKRHHHHHHHRKYTRCRNCGTKNESRKSIPTIITEDCEDTFVTVNDGLSVDATLYSSAIDEQAMTEDQHDDPTPMIW